MAKAETTDYGCFFGNRISTQPVVRYLCCNFASVNKKPCTVDKVCPAAGSTCLPQTFGGKRDRPEKNATVYSVGKARSHVSPCNRLVTVCNRRVKCAIMLFLHYKRLHFFRDDHVFRQKVSGKQVVAYVVPCDLTAYFPVVFTKIFHHKFPMCDLVTVCGRIAIKL